VLRAAAVVVGGRRWKDDATPCAKERDDMGTVTLSDADRRKLAARGRQIVAGNTYLTLATADAAGRPWASPVCFTPDGHERYLWASSPEARHSHNIAARPEVALTIFDSTVAIGQGEAVYVSARASVVPDDELESAAAVFAGRFQELAGYTSSELRPPSSLRLYQAVVSECSVLLRGADPRNPAGIDARVVVILG
jgi:nitroimidazol reductase NimA-like FMN-containing flavoprotein (pyridoxamine 5'-phosphate oxidase superfamily)